MINKRVAWNKGKKESIKHWYYTNGKTNIRIPYNQVPPEGFYRGRIVNHTEESLAKAKEKRKQTCEERYGNPYYNNMDKNKETKLERYGNSKYNNREKCKETCLEKYGASNVSKAPEIANKISNNLKGHNVSQETKNKISNARSGKHLTEEKLIQKIYNTNKTYHEKGLYKKHKTKPEIYIENILINIFGEDNVLYSYVDKERYPFKCDFYIPSEDLFIEVHAGWRHNKRPFNRNDKECINELKIWEEKSLIHPSFENAIYQWTNLDVRKLNVAKQNNLNYVCLYSDDIYFINEKPRELLETLVDLYRQQANQQPRRPIWS